MSDEPAQIVPKGYRGVGLPAPDSPAGLALLGSIILGICYIFVFVGAYSALSAEGLWIVVLNLTLAVFVSFFLVSMIGSEKARAENFELEFARTVQAHLAAGETLSDATPLGGILGAYAQAAHDQRRAAREHAYAAGPAVYSTAFALFATLLLGLAYAVGSDPNLIGFGMLMELPAFFLLVLSTAVLVMAIGRSKEVPEFAPFVLRRWTHVGNPSFPFTHSLHEVPWAARDIPTPTAPAAWQESGTPDRQGA